MSDDIRSKMEQAERKLAKQKAFLEAEITFPKGNKIPAQIKEDVIAALKQAAERLADGEVTAQVESFTAEEVAVLKQLAGRAMTKISQAAAPQAKAQAPVLAKQEPLQPIVTNKGTLVPDEQVALDLSNLQAYVGSEATLQTLEAVPVRQRGKVASGSVVRIEDVRPDGTLHVITPGGVRFNVEPEMLAFQSST